MRIRLYFDEDAMSRQQHYSVEEQMRRLLRLIGAKTAEEMHSELEFLSDWAHSGGN